MIRQRETWYHLPDKVTPEGKRTLPFSLGELGAIGGFEQGNNMIQYRGRYIYIILHIIQAEMLTACVSGDVEEWSSEYTQRESCRIANRSQLGSERNKY